MSDSAELVARTVKRQLQGMPSARYEVGILSADKSTAQMRDLDEAGVLRSVGWMRYQNSLGRTINIRPAFPSPYTFLDDLKPAQLAAMKANGLQPAVVVETSPENFQCWLRHHKTIEDPQLGTTVARELSRKLGADPSAAAYRHFGKLAGFTNRKENHLGKGSSPDQYPFVKLHSADGQIYDKSERVISYCQAVLQAEREQRRLQQERYQHTSQNTRILSRDDFSRNPKYRGDGHIIDFNFLMYGIDHSISKEDLRAAILSRSDINKKPSPERYFEGAYKRAEQMLGRRKTVSLSL